MQLSLFYNLKRTKLRVKVVVYLKENLEVLDFLLNFDELNRNLGICFKMHKIKPRHTQIQLIRIV